MTTNRITTALLAIVTTVAIAASSHADTAITEDDPRWNCHTMGNRICGTATMPTGEQAYRDPSAIEPDTGAWIGGYN